ncbi:hypothetical protein ACTFSJ_27765 [Bacillus cereus group sp. MYBK12-2]|uniref:hypothetical protein n=1 Tax=Bacillus cereus group sp. MYBK12-2 TaxID=3450689 RepID=UPI0032F5F752|nr:hypothetical protein [Bacillus pacificus]HDR7653583.1 hypothetical protein [Bacillus pacificus]
MSWGIVTKRQTKKITSPDGKMYVLIQKLSQGDRDDLNDILATMTMGKTDKEVANMNLGSMKHMQRKRSVVEWNLTDENGQLMPINDETLRNLSEDAANAIDDAIDELNPVKALSDDKKKQ